MTPQGTFTALVTPFNEDGSVDYGAFRSLVQWQVESGVEGVVPVGTSGESPTLDVKEHLKVIEATVEAVAGRAKVIAGTGANCTAEAIALTREVKGIGVDASLQVTPYYNKPNAEGLFRHFSAVAEIGVPVVLYNVPGRSGKEIPLEVVARLSSNPNIAAIKEAGGSVDRVSAIREICDMPVLSGDDNLALPMISVGAQGVISVVSNVIPSEFSAFIRDALAGKMAEASLFHTRYYTLFKSMFLDTNPICVKTALAMMGRVGPAFRLPLCEPTDEIAAKLRATLEAYGLLKKGGTQ